METLQIFRRVLRVRDLRRVELAYASFNITEYAVWIAMLVFAFNRGGATEASWVAAIQLLPAAICAPVLGTLSDRYPVAKVLAGGYVAQAAGMGMTAVAIAVGGPVALVYAGAIVASTTITITRPAQAVLMPSLARSPEDLTATNVVSSWAENGGSLVAGLATGALLAISDVGWVFGTMALIALAAAVLVHGVDGPGAAITEDDGASLFAEALAGFSAVRHHGHLRLLLGLLLAAWVLVGALDVLFVVLAIDVLERGEAWVGYLNAAWSVGGVAGGLAAVALVGRRHLARPIALGIVTCGAAIVVMAFWPSTIVVVLLLAVNGAGRVLLDVGSKTLLQRTTSATILGRVFGVLESMIMAGMAVGALIVPPLVALGGSKAALIGAGLLLPLVGLFVARPLLRVDRAARVPLVEIALLRSMPMFAGLPSPALEGIARALERVELPTTAIVIRAGDEGDRFYAIADGEVEVSRDGVVVARLERGDAFGEIALLENVPRNATVTALTDVRLYTLQKGPFVTAVTGHPPLARAAAAMVSQRREEIAAASPA